MIELKDDAGEGVPPAAPRRAVARIDLGPLLA